MTTVRQRIDTAHRDSIHDAQLNLIGSRLATCGSDRLVKIFEVRPNGQSFPIAELAGHSGPVWKISWANPKFGGILASAAYDKKVIIWREMNGRWQKSFEWTAHDASATSVAFAPSQFGLMLASSSADGDIGILRYSEQSSQWLPSKISKAHEHGVNAVSWAPVDVTVQPKKRLVSAGNDKAVKIWIFNEEKNEWECEKTLHGHTDYVKDVAWCPVANSSVNSIISCGMDGNLVLYRSKNINGDEWNSKLLEKSDCALYHVSWSPCGTFLSVSGDDNIITLWRENLQGQWIKVQRDINNEKETVA